MREILFRGKRADNGEWAYGMPCYGDDTFTISGVEAGLQIGDVYDVDPATVGQFTGLTDKNGKKIFEGDIINGYTMTGMNDRRGEPVTWSELFSGWYAGENKSMYGGLGEIYEVIGNIHDNPELVEEVK